MGQPKIELSRLLNRAFLQVGNESIEVADYKISTSMDGKTEIDIKISIECDAVKFETLTMTEQLPQQNSQSTNAAP